MQLTHEAVPFVGILLGSTQEVTAYQKALHHLLTFDDIRYVLFILLIERFEMGQFQEHLQAHVMDRSSNGRVALTFDLPITYSVSERSLRIRSHDAALTFVVVL